MGHGSIHPLAQSVEFIQYGHRLKLKSVTPRNNSSHPSLYLLANCNLWTCVHCVGGINKQPQLAAGCLPCRYSGQREVRAKPWILASTISITGTSSSNIYYNEMYSAVPGLTQVALDWPNFDVVGETSSNFCPHHRAVHDGKFGQIVLTTEKPGMARYTLPYLVITITNIMYRY